MFPGKRLIAFTITAFCFQALAAVPADLPKETRFWKKPELQKRMGDDRAVVVSVNTEKVDAPSQKKQLTKFKMRGAGHVNRDQATAFQLAQEYSRLKEVSDHFKTVKWDPTTSELFLITEALGYQARMIMKVTPRTVGAERHLNWEVIWGHFKGMKGTIGFERVDHRKTEVSFISDYEAEELPLPKALMGFALEVITQKVAEKMRSFLEKEPLKAKSAASANATAF